MKSAQNRRHNMSRTKTYGIWSAMKRRCDNERDAGFRNYGGRGIKYAQRWSSFDNFLADMGECPPGYSIERTDVNGNYEPSNCKWIPKSRQSANRRDSRMITFKGKTMCMADWGSELGVSYKKIHARMKSGYSFEDAISKESFPNSKPRSHCKNGHELTPENRKHQSNGCSMCLICYQVNKRGKYRMTEKSWKGRK